MLSISLLAFCRTFSYKHCHVERSWDACINIGQMSRPIAIGKAAQIQSILRNNNLQNTLSLIPHANAKGHFKHKIVS